jgi:hypothetical protein
MVTDHPVLISIRFLVLASGSQFVRPTVRVTQMNLIGAWQVFIYRVIPSHGTHLT